jgi:hypothetical protein
MVENGRITRIDIWNLGSPPVRTELGFGFGSRETDVIEVYGSRASVTPHPYLENLGSYITVDAPDHSRGIIFETDHRRDTVTSFRAGLYPALAYIEGCL